MTSWPTTSTQTADGRYHSPEPPEVFVSPNQKLWATLLVRGDVARNGNWAEVLVGSLESLDEASRPRIVARFFTHSLSNGQGGGAVELTLSSTNPHPLQWLPNSQSILLLWEDELKRKQVFSVDVQTQQVLQLTRHPTSVNTIAIHGESTVLYNADYFPARKSKAAQTPNGSIAENLRGTTIETLNFEAVLQGEFDSTIEGRYFKWYVLNGVQGKPNEIEGLAFSRHESPGLAFSNDGTLALVSSSPDSIPEAWDRYTMPFWRQAIQYSRKNRNDGIARQLTQLYVIDVRSRNARPLWDAPAMHGSRIEWSPNGRAVLIGPTFVPVANADADGLSGYATAVVDVRTGRIQTIPITPALAGRAAGSLHWLDSETVELQDGQNRLRYREQAGEWRLVPVRRSAERVANQSEPPVDVRVEEDIDAPPLLVAVERSSGRRRTIFDPNPRLRGRFALGRVTMIEWHDSVGRIWSGRLHYPVNWQSGRRYPLVIQTNGYPATRKFSLYGGSKSAPRLGPGASVQAAQPLANRGIFVLSAERKELPGIDGTPADAPMHAAAWEAVIYELATKGLIDSERVGLGGFSNTGYLVQYALAHSAFRYAAAITDDNFDGSYVQAILTGSETYANVNGAEPFADGLQLWLQRAPAFNAHKVRTPLRLQVTSPAPASILGSWEMFTRLRELQKPVEFFIIPDIRHGSHGIQNPGQCLASQDGTVDWFDFWLNNEEDADASKRDQYTRWRALRTLTRIPMTSSAELSLPSISLAPPVLADPTMLEPKLPRAEDQELETSPR